ncbi:MAG TPA: DUF2141 domain-containing protein [Chitinophagaceae bacterium]|nr:DUF2141 domain-containing protein [Chitinophagaceae bacterium]
MKRAAVIWMIVFAGVLHLGASRRGGEVALRIEVTNLKSSKGFVLISVFDNAKYFPKEAGKAVAKTRASIQNGIAVASFDGFVPGTYAVAILHDENNNLKMDFNLVGMPKEGYGFSNNAKGVFGPPGFDKAAFRVEGVEKTISIKASYFLR